MKQYANSLKNIFHDFTSTNLIIYGNGQASDNFWGGEFKQGGKTVVMNLGKDNQLFWLMSVCAPAHAYDDGGIPNFLDLFGDSHPMYSDKNFTKSELYKGLVFSGIENTRIVYGKNNVNMYYLPTTVYNVSTAERIYGYISITRQQAEAGLHLKLQNK